MVKGGFDWELWYGECISLWFDAWLLSDPFCLIVDDIDLDEIWWTVNHTHNDNGEWRPDHLHIVLPMFVVEKIHRLNIPLTQEVKDKPVWKSNKSGIMLAKSFFKFLYHDDDANSSNHWGWIWRLSCLPKIRMFVWLVMHEPIPKNSLRHSIGISPSNTYARCESSAETIIYKLRDCPKSLEV